MPIGSRYQGGTHAPAQDHEVMAGQGRAATRSTLWVATMSLLAVSRGIDRWARVVVQQVQPRRWQVGSEPGDADADVVDVIESGLFGPAVLSAGPHAEPESGRCLVVDLRREPAC
jgi:hypothetical protein